MYHGSAILVMKHTECLNSIPNSSTKSPLASALARGLSSVHNMILYCACYGQQIMELHSVVFGKSIINVHGCQARQHTYYIHPEHFHTFFTSLRPCFHAVRGFEVTTLNLLYHK